MCPRLNSTVSMPPVRVVWGSMLGVWSRVFTVKSQNMLCFVYQSHACVCVRKGHDG